MPKPNRVCVAEIVAAHGVRGLVKLRSFTEVPAAVADYGPLSDVGGERTLSVSIAGSAGPVLLARIEGVSDRTAAEALVGRRLYVDRTALPLPDEDEFYYADLIGLMAVRVDGKPLGRVRAVHDYGAGSFVEIDGETGRGEMIPFTRAAVPEIDVPGGWLSIDPPRDLGEGRSGDGRSGGGPAREAAP